MNWLGSGIAGKMASLLMGFLILQVGLFGPAMGISGTPLSLGETFESFAIEAMELACGDDIDIPSLPNPIKLGFSGQQQVPTEEDVNENESHSFREWIETLQLDIPVLDKLQYGYMTTKPPVRVVSVATPPPEKA